MTVQYADIYSVDTSFESDSQRELLSRFESVRQTTEVLCSPLTFEEYGLQAMPGVSPPKWHLAHTTWFFEVFILNEYDPGYTMFHDQYWYLFNSYYEGVGPQFPRSKRGLLARPTVEEIYRYRAYVNKAIRRFILSGVLERERDVSDLIVLGCQHEQQHQELLLTDTKFNFSANPLKPVYYNEIDSCVTEERAPALCWYDVPGGVSLIGSDGNDFCFDNELPAHTVSLDPYALATRLVTNGEYLEFMDAGGYENPLWWLSDGWSILQSHKWKSPLYWEYINGTWWQYSLSGMRLPTEEEWESLARTEAIEGNFFYPQDRWQFTGIRLAEDR